jgi:ABC-2 type transport system ATP-binding protein
MLALKAKDLFKQFPKTKSPAVRELSFEIKPGETVAFLGPNGAGKSTTIKMLCGILTPTSGSATIGGFAAGSRQANQQLGLVFGTRSQLYLHMTVRQSLDLVAEIYGVTGATKRSRIDELATQFEIRDLLDRRTRTLSLGQRMRCEVVAALIHRPRILLADEPTIGLDVVVKNGLRELVRRWQRDEGTTLMLTSHDLSDVEALCDRCILIDLGEKRFDGSLASLKGDFASVRRIRVTTATAEAKAFNQDRRLKAQQNGDSSFTHLFELSTREIAMSEALSLLSRHYGDHLQDISITEVTLEEVLGKLYGGER